VTTFRNTIALSLQQHLDAATEFWGVCVERIDIKNVKIPADMQFALSAEAQATREAIAKYIAADGEKGASMALKEAADNMDPMAVQLRFLQTLNNSLTIDVDAVVLYRVHNSIVAVTNVRNYRRATELLAATTVRNLLGTKTLTQILAECSLINDALRLMPFIDQYCIIDCRMICYDIPAQKVLTKDSLTIDVDAVVLYRVHNSIVAVTNVRNYYLN
ncbi:unnamed protein product, partial [Medioppia subpectinata]